MSDLVRSGPMLRPRHRAAHLVNQILSIKRCSRHCSCPSARCVTFSVAAESLRASPSLMEASPPDGVYRPLRGGGENQTDGDAIPAVYQEQGNASRLDTND